MKTRLLLLGAATLVIAAAACSKSSGGGGGGSPTPSGTATATPTPGPINLNGTVVIFGQPTEGATVVHQSPAGAVISSFQTTGSTFGLSITAGDMVTVAMPAAGQSVAYVMTILGVQPGDNLVFAPIEGINGVAVGTAADLGISLTNGFVAKSFDFSSWCISQSEASQPNASAFEQTLFLGCENAAQTFSELVTANDSTGHLLAWTAATVTNNNEVTLPAFSTPTSGATATLGAIPSNVTAASVATEFTGANGIWPLEDFTKVTAGTFPLRFPPASSVQATRRFVSSVGKVAFTAPMTENKILVQVADTAFVSTYTLDLADAPPAFSALSISSTSAARPSISWSNVAAIPSTVGIMHISYSWTSSSGILTEWDVYAPSSTASPFQYPSLPTTLGPGVGQANIIPDTTTGNLVKVTYDNVGSNDTYDTLRQGSGPFFLGGTLQQDSVAASVAAASN